MERFLRVCGFDPKSWRCWPNWWNINSLAVLGRLARWGSLPPSAAPTTSPAPSKPDQTMSAPWTTIVSPPSFRTSCSQCESFWTLHPLHSWLICTRACAWRPDQLTPLPGSLPGHTPPPLEPVPSRLCAPPLRSHSTLCLPAQHWPHDSAIACLSHCDLLKVGIDLQI